MRTSILGKIGCGLLLGALSLSAAHAQLVSLDVLTRSGYGVVPLKRPKPNLLAVDANIDGHDVQLVLDTGCTHIVLRRVLQSRLGLKTSEVKGQISGITGKRRETKIVTATADKMRLGNVQVTGVPVVFSELGVMNYDSSPGAPVGSYLPPPSQRAGDGFLGADFLSACSAVIDLQNLKLYLRPPGLGRRVDLGPGLRGIGMTEIPFSNPEPTRFHVHTEVNGVPGEMLLDTGDYLTALSLSHSAALHLQSFHSRLVSRDITGATTQVSRVSLQSFKVGAFSAPTDDTVTLENLDLSSESSLFGLLGMDVIGRCAGVIDCGNRKLYLIKTR